VHHLTVRRQRAGVEAPAGTHIHRWDAVPRRRLAAAVAELKLDTLLLNPERSRHFRGVRANVLRPGYGTDHYSQKLSSFSSTPGTWARRALRVAPWVLAERRWERAYYEAPPVPPHVIAVSRYMREEVLATYEVPPENVHVVHNGVDLDEFSPARRTESREARRAEHGIPPSATCLLFMGHNFRLKGLWDLLVVVEMLHREGRDVHLLVAGRGTGEGQRRQAARLIRRHGLEGRVHLLGDVQPATDAFAAADLFVHLSWHDAFGFVVLEAMACGLPVVTTPLAGASEVLEDDVSGLLVQPDDPAAIAAKIARVIDPDVRIAMGRAALAEARKRPEEENFRRVLEVLETADAGWDGAVR
jgi:glycosyltransferase involved in cell wall biosynthesis